MKSAVPRWVWWTGAVLILVGLPVAYKPRGIRNHNPGNLRPLSGGDTWDGQVGLDTAGGGPFVVFGFYDGKPGEFWGIRALAKTLYNYQTRYGLTTPRAIIERYAPASENDTDAYAAAVASALGVGPDQPIDVVNNPGQHSRLTQAIIRHENGMQPYDLALVASVVEAGRA